MINISNVSLHYNNIYENSHRIITENRLAKRISAVTKNIFRYFHANQNALRAAIWSYLFIQAGGLLSESISTRFDYDLEKCQDIICNLWSNSTENRKIFAPSIELRCDPFHPKYRAYYFIEKCMGDLCDFVEYTGKNIHACFSFNNYMNLSSIEKKPDLVSKLWDKLCPKMDFRHPNLVKKATYINSCLITVCTYFNTFEFTLEPDLAKICETVRTHKIHDLLDKLSNIIHEAEKKTKDDDSWSRANVIASIIASITTVTVSVIATITSIITYRISKAKASAADASYLMTGVREVLRGVTETTTALVNTQLTETQLLPDDPAMNNLLSEVQNLMTEVTEIVENLASSSTSAITAGQSAGAHLMMAGGASIMGMVVEGKERGGGEKGGEQLLRFDDLPVVTDKNYNIATDPINISLSTNETHIDNWKTFIQYFVDDLQFYSLNGFNIIKMQANRLKPFLQNWDNAYCYYNEELFCRFPLPEHENETILYLPDHHIKYIISRELQILCYRLLDNLWCNFSIYFPFLSGSNDKTNFVDPHCPWDLVQLHSHIDEDTYTIEARGKCYNQTVVFKV